MGSNDGLFASPGAQTQATAEKVAEPTAEEKPASAGGFKLDTVSGSETVAVEPQPENVTVQEVVAPALPVTVQVDDVMVSVPPPGAVQPATEVPAIVEEKVEQQAAPTLDSLVGMEARAVIVDDVATDLVLIEPAPDAPLPIVAPITTGSPDPATGVLEAPTEFSHETQPDSLSPEKTAEFHEAMQILSDNINDKEIVGNAIQNLMNKMHEDMQFRNLLEPADFGLMVRGLREAYGVIVAKKAENKAKRAGKSNQKVDDIVDTLAGIKF